MGPATNRDTYLRRVLEISPLLEDTSVFLFGPRQTGKSSYIANQLSEPPALVYNLLDRGLLLRLMADPTAMRQEILARNLRSSLVCIDEVQKLPELLDEVHLLIEERRIRFLLTGSSARKLRRSGTNLLGGRGRDRVMHPFVYPEVRDHGFSLDRMMHAGLLPPHFLSRNPDEDLAAYVDRYLTEEIAAEGAARNLPAFARFLRTAATMNTRMVNYTNVANDAQVPRQTVQLWFQILQDALVAFELGPFTKTVKRKAISTSKLYFFDPRRQVPSASSSNQPHLRRLRGVLRALHRPGSPGLGRLPQSSDRPPLLAIHLGLRGRSRPCGIRGDRSQGDGAPAGAGPSRPAGNQRGEGDPAGHPGLP